MKIRPTKEQRDAAILAAGRIEQATSIVNLAADGTRIEISDEERDALLAKCAAGEHVRLIIEVLAYEHKPGEPNRRYVRIRDGAVLSAAKTAVGRPFLRDHEQLNSLARGGTILESRGIRRGEGDYAIEMRVELTAPWAVEMALRGLLTFVSVGLRPTGPVMCSHCKSEIFTKCLHFPGDEIASEVGGEVEVCEWIYTAVEIVELSAVNVPAVPGAHIEGIRAALSAALNVGEVPTEERQMKNLPMLLAALNLAATASEEEILSAVEALPKRIKTLETELEIKGKDLAAVTAERDALKEAKLAADAKAFIDEAIGLGKIAPADAETWSTLYALDSDKAVKLMADRKPGTATPVAVPRQSPPANIELTGGAAPATEPVITGGIERARTFAKRVEAQLAAAVADVAKNTKALAYAAHVFGFNGAGKIEIPSTLAAPTSISNHHEMEAANIGFRAALLEAVVGEPDPVMQLATEVASNKAVENYKWLGDLPQMQEWKNDRILKQLEAYGWAIENKKWENALRVKNDDFLDDALGLLPAHVNALGEEARLQPSILIARLLLNGFAGTAFPELGDGLAFDGKFFFDTTHETGSNKLAVAFSAENLVTASTMLRKQKRFDGRNLGARGTHLFVSVEDEELATKILTQEYLANGESNTLRNKFKLEVVTEFQNGEWMLADLSKPVKPMLFQNREGIQTQTVGGRSQSDMVGFMYDETWFGATARNNAGYWDFRRIVGSKP